MANRAEEFVRWYLRFNGYFSIENFVVHAADEAKRIREGDVPQDAECDLLGVRLPYSAEVAGVLFMANHPLLTDGAAGRTDLVIGESKTGNKNEPNRVWKHASTHKDIVGYVLRFCGLLAPGPEFEKAVDEFAKKYRYEDASRRIRYVIFSNEPHPRHAKRGVTYITYASIIEYIVEVRGHSWTRNDIGVASLHQQWSETIKHVFRIANDPTKSLAEKKQEVTTFLNP
jgi:hypothetical protein